MYRNGVVRGFVLTGFLAAFALLLPACSPAGPKFNGIDVTGASFGRDFRLTDPDGRERTLSEFRGRYVMLFFGYIHCPDVCPTSLARAAEVRKALGAEGKRLQVIFVTVDPERDTPQLMRAYTEAFDPSFLGLRSDPEGTRKVAEEFRTFYQKAQGQGTYTVDHSAFTYVYDDQSRLRLMLRYDQSAEQCLADLRALMRAGA
ncbi:MAG: SCO family protein [Burkholderiales bacterium]|nr:SCO family protein [Burkholderiales bacterium]